MVPEQLMDDPLFLDPESGDDMIVNNAIDLGTYLQPENLHVAQIHPSLTSKKLPPSSISKSSLNINSLLGKSKKKTKTKKCKPMDLTGIAKAMINTTPDQLMLSHQNLVGLNMADLSDFPRSTLRAFTSLDLSHNQLTRIQSIAMIKLPHLRRLNLRHNAIQYVSHIGHFDTLMSLDLSFNHVGRVKSLRACSQLRELYLAGNQIRVIEGLEHLVQLEVLDLDFNPITHLLSLRNVSFNRALKSLSLVQNPVSRHPDYRVTLTSILPKLEDLDHKTLPRYRPPPPPVEKPKKHKPMSQSAQFEADCRRHNVHTHQKKKDQPTEDDPSFLSCSASLREAQDRMRSRKAQRQALERLSEPLRNFSLRPQQRRTPQVKRKKTRKNQAKVRHKPRLAKVKKASRSVEEHLEELTRQVLLLRDAVIPVTDKVRASISRQVDPTEMFETLEKHEHQAVDQDLVSELERLLVG